MAYTKLGIFIGLGMAFVLSTSGHASQGGNSSGVFSCVMAGSEVSVPCDAVQPGSTIALDLRSVRSPGPITLFFHELSQSRKRLVTRLTVPREARASDGRYRLVVPTSICTDRRGRTRQEIRQLLPAFNVTETIGVITVNC